MKQKTKSFFLKHIKRKRTWIILALIIFIVLYLIFKQTDISKNAVTDIATISNLKETVLATGQVVSNTDLNLSFNSSGIVKSIKVKVGDSIKKGELLATLNYDLELAALTSARGSLAAAKARLNKTIEGASDEEISLSNIALANAKRDYENIKTAQDTLVKNAYYNLLNSNPEAVPGGGISDYTPPTLSGNYNLGKEGIININTYYTGNGTNFSLSGLTSGSGIVTTTTSQAVGDSGLYITFPSTSNLNSNSWTITIPNIKASNYLTNYNIYQSALKTQQSAIASALSLVDQRTAELAIKKSVARSSDIDLGNANILSAEGQYQQALARYNNTIIRAPVGGTITSIDIKVGELAVAQRSVIILQDISNIYIETNINEANISSLKIGMPIDITYDSFGEDRIFTGTLSKIDPSSTLVSGVVNYKVTASTEQSNELRPGMTANMTINIMEKDNIITIPSRSIVTDENGNRTLRVVTNSRTKSYENVPIITGLEGDSGMIEVIDGIKIGDEYIILIKK